MKANIMLLIAGAVLQGLTFVAHAQIRDNEASANVLSIQCSVSSGHAVDGFAEYSRKLAKTLALLSPVQQTRVFGYLPQPSNIDSEEDVTTPATSGGGEAALTSESGALEGLVGLVGDFNTALSGSASGTSPVYGGVSPEAPADEPTQAWGSIASVIKEENASRKEAPSSWDALIERFLAAVGGVLSDQK